MNDILLWLNQYMQPSFASQSIPSAQVIVILGFVSVMAAYLFFVYRVVSRRAMYNKSFNISIALLQFFISTIILCLQSSVVITLGTIGALAIIRFRTAIKDPVDMIYLLWAVHIGIMAGCELYEVALLTSIFATVVLLILENIKVGRSSYTLVVNCKNQLEAQLSAAVKPYARRMRIKSRNFTSSGVDYVLDLAVRDPQALSQALAELDGVSRFSLIEYDSEDIV